MEPSLTAGGLAILSLGRGGKTWVTAAIVRTTILARFRAASSSVTMAGEGCGCNPTAFFASLSSQLLPMASCLSSSVSACSGPTCAFTLRTVT